MKQIRSILGIVLYERTIAVCQAELVNNTFSVHGSACYTMPEGQTDQTLLSQTADFKAFLKEHGFKAKKAVVGLPVKQMMTTLVKTPSVKDPNLFFETIKMNLERKIEGDISEIAFDYDAGSGTGQTDTLVTMILKRAVTQIKGLLESCRIKPIQITNTSLGLDMTAAGPAVCHIIDYPASFEMCLFHDGTLTAVHHLPKHPGEGLDIQTAQKIVRLVGQTLWSTTRQSGTTAYKFWTFDGQSQPAGYEISAIFGNLDSQRLKKTSDVPLCSFAAALAQRTLSSRPIGIDYLKSHYSQTKPTWVKRWLPKASMAAAAVLLLVGIFAFNWYSDSREIANLQLKLDSMKESVAAAQEVIDRVTTVRQWFSEKPFYLEVMRELSVSFPLNSSIWLTSLAIDESHKQILTGRATGEKVVLDVAEALRKKPVFENVQVQYIRKMGQGTDILTFAISLNCREES